MSPWSAGCRGRPRPRSCGTKVRPSGTPPLPRGDTARGCDTGRAPRAVTPALAGEQALAAFPAGSQRALLRLQAVREEDAGLYSCRALGEAGIVSDSTLSVHAFICIFNLCKLRCAVTACKSPALRGLPPLEMGWGRGGWSLSLSLLRALQPHQAEASPHCAPGASLDDQAIYICEAQNEFGKIHAEVKLTVTGQAPEIALASPVVRVLPGQPVSLPCVILAGSPFPARRWLKDGQTVRIPCLLGSWRLCWGGNFGLSPHQGVAHFWMCPRDLMGESLPSSLPCPLQGTEPISPSPHYQLDPDGTLLIPSSSPGDAGTYFCTATNAAGFSSREMQLSISTKPRISVNGSQTSDPVPILAVLGQETTLPCEAQGSPPPLVLWSRDFPVPSPPRFSVLPSGSLHLAEPQVTDNGLYTCTATNAAGNASLSYSLHVQGSNTLSWPSFLVGAGSLDLSGSCPLSMRLRSDGSSPSPIPLHQQDVTLKVPGEKPGREQRSLPGKNGCLMGAGTKPLAGLGSSGGTGLSCGPRLLLCQALVCARSPG
uniref:Uncharacterized protein n=1 Tax=Geospiza parvula TaxID=87175 RepID=A0A8U8BUV7_GEOPR